MNKQKIQSLKKQFTQETKENFKINLFDILGVFYGDKISIEQEQAVCKRKKKKRIGEQRNSWEIKSILSFKEVNRKFKLQKGHD